MDPKSTKQHSVWWFSEDQDILVLQKSFNNKFPVVDVKEGPDARSIHVYLVEDKEDKTVKKVKVSLDTWKTVDRDFQPLDGYTSRSKFVSKLSTLMEDLSISFFVTDMESSEDELAQLSSKKKYRHNVNFIDQVQIMRDLHPKKEEYNETEFWDSSCKEWRQLCANSLGFTKGMEGTFGGLFRERIYVATMPTSCFDIVLEIASSMRDGLIRSTNKKTTMTSGLFQSFVGFKLEFQLRSSLSQLNNGITTVKEFRDSGKTLKNEENRSQESRPIEAMNIVQQQRLQIQQLEESNRLLTEENERLKQQIQEQNAVEPFAVGMTVLALWHQDDQFYEAKILSKRQNGYYVRFVDDGIKSTVQTENLKRLSS